MKIFTFIKRLSNFGKLVTFMFALVSSALILQIVIGIYGFVWQIP